MKISEMRREECLRLLSGVKLCRLGCSRENQPYVVPVYLAYDEYSGYLFGFTTPGQKIEWMRANPLVCVETDEIAAHDRWESVVAFGVYQELPQSQEQQDRPPPAPQRPRQVDDGPAGWQGDSREGRIENEESKDGREKASRLLNADPNWSEPGCAAWASREHRDPAQPFVAVYYRIRIDTITGHRATADGENSINPSVKTARAGRWSQIWNSLMRLSGRSSS